jgi:hypothetical protein
VPAGPSVRAAAQAAVDKFFTTVAPQLFAPVSAGAVPVAAAVAGLVEDLPKLADLTTGLIGSGFPLSAPPLTGSSGSGASHAGGLLLFAVLLAFSLLWLGRSWRLLPLPVSFNSLNLLWLPERPG